MLKIFKGLGFSSSSNIVFLWWERPFSVDVLHVLRSVNHYTKQRAIIDVAVGEGEAVDVGSTVLYDVYLFDERASGTLKMGTKLRTERAFITEKFADDIQWQGGFIGMKVHGRRLIASGQMLMHVFLRREPTPVNVLNISGIRKNSEECDFPPPQNTASSSSESVPYQPPRQRLRSGSEDFHPSRVLQAINDLSAKLDAMNITLERIRSSLGVPSPVGIFLIASYQAVGRGFLVLS
ncbi:unnamed protein product [Enterobius vermicularis]|uniref:Uncharacterized protein n=1 Tax=Enterobius vermicularis TaxID=51028 RepID=A0A0N4UZ05_ENTVE|nr:unnamed protein product [Enterobius vermicularis]